MRAAPPTDSADCCVIGGGIVGLSIARELAGRGRSVLVLARGGVRETASWAAVGIFPPAPCPPGCPPGEALTAWSDRLHRQWARELLDETGIDNELRACGGLHLATEAGGLERLEVDAADWSRRGVRCERLDAAGIAACEPALAVAAGRGAIVGGLLLPDEQRFRPPRHLEALERSCRARGVGVRHDAVVEEVIRAGDRVEAVVARIDGSPTRIRAGVFVLAAGAWTGMLGEAFGLRIATRPVRGQIALLRSTDGRLGRVVNRGLDYLVPRDDGRLLVGSTLEDVGFKPEPTADAIARLLRVAGQLLGGPVEDRLERAWAGLRPGSADGLPTIGRIPACVNAFVAAGHFRAGLHQSTGTAVMVCDMIEGLAPQITPDAFAPGRAAPGPEADVVSRYVARAAVETS